MTGKGELTGKPTLMKELNIGLIREALEICHQATRVELASLTGISQPTINQLIRQLIEEETVVSLGMADSTGGRKAEVFALNRKRSFILQIIIDEQQMEYVVADMELKEEACGYRVREKSQTYEQQLNLLIEEILAKQPGIKAIVLGVPGAVTEEGAVFAIPDIPEWENRNLQKFLENKYGIPVAVVNDINAVAMGYSKNTAVTIKNMVYLHLGSGVGAGIIVDGKLYSGYRSFAGEVGYMLPEGSQEPQKMKDEEQIAVLSQIVTGMICVLNPEVLVMGGGLSFEVYDMICKMCCDRLPQEILPEFEWCETERVYYKKGLGKIGITCAERQLKVVP